MTKAIQFKHFDKFNFVESFIATVSDPKVKEEEKKRAVIIAEAIEESQGLLLENLATKQDLKILEKELKQDLQYGLVALEQKLTIKLTAIMAALLTFLPLVTEFLKKLF